MVLWSLGTPCLLSGLRGLGYKGWEEEVEENRRSLLSTSAGEKATRFGF